MKTKFTEQEQENIKGLISSPQLGGGANFNELEKSLNIIKKLNGRPEIEFEDSEVLKICQVAEAFQNWPVTQETLDFKKKLEEYKAKAKA